jgi:hypothetical protein
MFAISNQAVGGTVQFNPKKKAFNDMIGAAYRRSGNSYEEAALQHDKKETPCDQFIKVEDSTKSHKVTEFKTSMVRQRKVSYITCLSSLLLSRLMNCLFLGFVYRCRLDKESIRRLCRDDRGTTITTTVYCTKVGQGKKSWIRRSF